MADEYYLIRVYFIFLGIVIHTFQQYVYIRYYLHHEQGRIQDFAQGGSEIKKSILTSRGARFYHAKCGIVFSRALFRPPINIIRVNNLGKTHIKKVVGPVV